MKTCIRCNKEFDGAYCVACKTELDARSDEQYTVKHITGSSTMNRNGYEAYQKDLECRHAIGRYSINEAAQFVENNSRANAISIFTKLIKSAETGELTTYYPGSDEVYTPVGRSRDLGMLGFEETFWKDLNEWLEKNEPRLDYKFPKPDAPTAKVQAVQGASPSGEDWQTKALAIADRLALEKYQRGEREITARNTCEAVAIELAKDATTHGTRGQRSGGSIRSVALKGWKFIPPAGTNGTSGTKK